MEATDKLLYASEIDEEISTSSKPKSEVKTSLESSTVQKQ